MFLVPTATRIRATGDERGQLDVVVQRNLLLAAHIATEADDFGFRVLLVDRPLDGMIARVGAELDAVIARLPRGGDLAAIRRHENDVLAEQVRLYRASGEAPPGSPPLPFACECGAAGCDAVVELPIEEYDAISAAGDRSPLRLPTP